jgi:hypothetical protein
VLEQVVASEEDAESEFYMKASTYSAEGKARGLDIITWFLERTDPGLTGWYWQSTQDVEVCESVEISKQLESVCTTGLTEGDKFNLLYVLAFEVEILGMFSDWPATTTFFANCYDLSLIVGDVDPGTDGETDDGTYDGTDDESDAAISAFQVGAIASAMLSVANALLMI